MFKPTDGLANSDPILYALSHAYRLVGASAARGEGVDWDSKITTKEAIDGKPNSIAFVREMPSVVWINMGLRVCARHVKQYVIT